MDSNPKDDALTGWQLLGELKLSYASNIEAVIYTWLLEILEPLKLPTDFMEKVNKSVLNAALDFIESEAKSYNHIHLLIFVRKQETDGTLAWGFFRIEKLEDTTQEKSNHAIEYYLYPDG